MNIKPFLFWRKVAVVGNVCECWEWLASKKVDGYGRCGIGDGKLGYAHRVSYELTIGPIGVGLQLDHLCRNRSCVNPWHLEPVTQQENTRRGEAGKNMRDRTHCPRGHEYTPQNIRASKAGKRGCKTCHCERERERRWLCSKP